MKSTLLITVMLATFYAHGSEEKINKECSDFPQKNLDAMVQSAVDKCNGYGVSFNSEPLSSVLSPNVNSSQVMSANSCIAQCQEKMKNGVTSAEQCIKGLVAEGVKGFDETFTDKHLISTNHCIAVNNNMKNNLKK
jgi:hypothetical protein